jgi:hypothetical protein
MSDQPVLGAALRAALKKIKIREGDQVREVPAYEALLDAIFTYGVKGNARYGGLALDMFRTAEQAHAREVRESNALWQSYKDVKSAELARPLLRASATIEYAVTVVTLVAAGFLQ